METANQTLDNLAKLKEMFPEVITESKDENGEIVAAVDAKKLEQLLSTKVIDGDESYDFTWVGKKQAMIEACKPIRKTLRPCREESVDWENTQNIYIEGDNLDVLKLLQESYLNKVKMIYIDPPYNTGNDSFIYPDDYSTNKDAYDEEVGAIDESGYRMFKNTETNGRFHSSWCSMMYPRLKLARNLLSEDGVIFISIDDNEQANLKKICDEVFGVSNFYGMLIQLKGNTQNDSKSIQKNHEYILVYTKENCQLLLTYNNDVPHEVFENSFYLGRDTGASSGHDTLLERTNLGYTIYYYEGTQSGATGNHNTLLERTNLGYTIYYYEGTQSGATGNHNTLLERTNLVSKKYPGFNYFENSEKFIHAVAVMDYDAKKITGDSTETDVYTDDKELLSLGYVKIRPPKRKGGKLGCWTWSLSNFKDLWNKNEVLIKKNKNVIKKEFVCEDDIVEINEKKYFIKSNNLPLQSLVKITNSAGTTVLNGNDGLMPGIGFNNPKNPELLKYFMQSYNGKNKRDITILDFFSGSATTAHAVMQLNAEDGGKRKFIMVQLPEVCDEKSEAYKAGYKNICEIGKERIRRAGKKIVEESGKIDLDIGFRVLKLDDGNMKDVYYTPEEYNQKDLVDMASNIKDDRTPEDLLYACMLEWGLELSLPHKVQTVAGYNVHIVDEGALVACFDDKISEDAIKQIAELQPLRAVFRDSGFAGDAARVNVGEIFKLKSPNTTIKVL